MAQSIIDFTVTDSNKKTPLDPLPTNDENNEQNNDLNYSAPSSFTEQKVDIENNVEELKQSPKHCTQPSLSEDHSYITNSSSESNSASINVSSTETENPSNEQDFASNTRELDSVLIENTQNSSIENDLQNTEKNILNENTAICEISEENSSSEDNSITPEGNSSSEPVTPDHQKNWDEERRNFIRITEYVKELESVNAGLENEISELKLRLSHQELSFKEAELKMRAEFLNNIEKLSKECNILRKEKEAIVIRYANSEKEVIKEKKIQQELEKKIKDLNKDRDNLLSKIKGLSSENSRLSSSYESKMVDIAKLQKNFDKLNADFNSREIRIKWLQNKLKTETGSHQSFASGMSAPCATILVRSSINGSPIPSAAHCVDSPQKKDPMIHIITLCAYITHFKRKKEKKEFFFLLILRRGPFRQKVGKIQLRGKVS
ncbi:Coiled-coil domain-containing protein 186 [Argiope bruennichi]|uniref:Coiled-coil domain-containing protein 186 n=1 Tax=Argiope bruennichi TaxID=94029 RepID=A0A8T0FLY1_ARGBR|nr:Coiled-coil domain-containing protein 186 [Argiope bruennichi]